MRDEAGVGDSAAEALITTRDGMRSGAEAQRLAGVVRRDTLVARMNLAPKQFHPATRADLDALPPTWRGEVWYIDPDGRTLTVNRLEDGRWLELAVVGGDQVVRVEPFDAVEISLDAWREGVTSEE